MLYIGANLANLINRFDTLNEVEIKKYDELSSKRIDEAYSWDSIVDQYEREFMKA